MFADILSYAEMHENISQLGNFFTFCLWNFHFNNDLLTFSLKLQSEMNRKVFFFVQSSSMMFNSKTERRIALQIFTVIRIPSCESSLSNDSFMRVNER